MYDYVSSLPAYKEDKTKCREVVLSAIKKLGICNDRQLSAHLGWAINRINPRRGELVESGLVRMAYKAPDPLSGRTVSFWCAKVYSTQQGLFQ